MKHLKIFEDFNSDEIDYDMIQLKLKDHGWGDISPIRFDEFEKSEYYSGTLNTEEYAEEMNDYLRDISTGDKEDKDRSMYDPSYGDDEDDEGEDRNVYNPDYGDDEEDYPKLRIPRDMPSYKTKYRYSDDEEDDNIQEKKKWIQDAIKKPGSLRKSLGKKEGEKISAKEIDSELQALRGKDKDPKKKGVQGLSKRDLAKYRKLNLAKTLKGLKEHQETQNYMFFSNLETIKRLSTELLQMDRSKLDAILSEHNWALDHMATSKDDVEEVFNFFASHNEPHHEEPQHYDEPSHEETEGHLANKDLEDEMKNLKSFGDFK